METLIIGIVGSLCAQAITAGAVWLYRRIRRKK
jgi:hypothetical protein